ncbi:MAG: MarR family transcriptional regulator [Patescibacteria group bacterium]|nr:MarR family transcriptional regulator [Patescibacteria group bacterium]
MLKKFIDSLAAGKKQIPTYQLSLLQSKSNRIIKQITNVALKKYRLSYVDWAFLGILFEKNELRYGSIAEELGVEPSFVSVLVQGLQKKGYVREKINSVDRRVKQITLTKKGADLIPEIEDSMRNTFETILQEVTLADMQRYVAVLQSIARVNKEVLRNSEL